MVADKVYFTVDYCPVAIQHFRIKIYRGEGRDESDCYGQYDFTLGELIAKRGENL